MPKLKTEQSTVQSKKVRIIDELDSLFVDRFTGQLNKVDKIFNLTFFLASKDDAVTWKSVSKISGSLNTMKRLQEMLSQMIGDAEKDAEKSSK